METMIANQYIVDMLAKNQASVEKAHIVLDRVLATTARNFPESEIRVNTNDSVFLVDLGNNNAIKIEMSYIDEGAVVTVGNNDTMYAIIAVNADGVMNEQYGKFPTTEMRSAIRGYFAQIGETDYVSPLVIPDPESVPEEAPTVETDIVDESDNDGVEIHFTGEDNE